MFVTRDSNTSYTLTILKQENMSASSDDMMCGRPSSADSSGVHCRLGLPMVRPSLQSPPVSKHVHKICSNFWRLVTFSDLDL